jgi:hypothetical protein
VFLWDITSPIFLSLELLIFYILQFGKSAEITFMMPDRHAGNNGRLDYLLHEHYLGKKRNQDGV